MLQLREKRIKICAADPYLFGACVSHLGVSPSINHKFLERFTKRHSLALSLGGEGCRQQCAHSPLWEKRMLPAVAAKDQWLSGASNESAGLLARSGGGARSQDTVRPYPRGFLLPSGLEVHFHLTRRRSPHKWMPQTVQPRNGQSLYSKGFHFHSLSPPTPPLPLSFSFRIW